jgi:hypothetical protein
VPILTRRLGGLRNRAKVGRRRVLRHRSAHRSGGRHWSARR